MIDIVTTVAWTRQAGERFVDRRYSRAHVWRFDGGASVAASASPHIVPLPHSVEANVDPEEAFVAALSSCHLLCFLDVAARAGLVVDAYADDALGVMEKDETGSLWVSRVTLRPRVRYDGKTPDAAAEAALHHAAHEVCFIARSVRTTVSVEPSPAP